MVPSREALLRKRITTIAAYAASVHSQPKMTKARSLSLYGSAIAPVLVPLRPNETPRDFEARFRAWLFRERNCTVDALRSNANLERSYRIAFVRAEARAFWAAGVVKEEDEDVKDKDLVKMEHVDTLETVGRTLVLIVGTKREREDDKFSDDDDTDDDGDGSFFRHPKRRAERARLDMSDDGSDRHSNFETASVVSEGNDAVAIEAAVAADIHGANDKEENPGEQDDAADLE